MESEDRARSGSSRHSRNDSAADTRLLLIAYDQASWTVLDIHGELNETTVGHLYDHLRQRIAGGARRLRVNLTDVQVADGEAMADLRRIAALRAARGGVLRLAYLADDNRLVHAAGA